MTVLAAAEALQPSKAVMGNLLASMRVTEGALRQVREAWRPNQQTIREMIDATHVTMDMAATRNMIAATQPRIDQKAIRQMVEMTQPSQAMINDMIEALRPSQAMIRETMRSIGGTRPEVFQMSGFEVAAAARLAADAAPSAAEELEDVGAVAEGQEAGSFFDWLSGLEPAIQSRAFLILLRALAALTVEAYAELEERPPDHLALILVVLFCVAEMIGDQKGK